MRALAVVAVVAFPALAAVPEKGEGTITLMGGLRSIVAPTNGEYLAQQQATHDFLQPGGIASFGYQYDEELHFKIEIGYGIDRYRFAAGGPSLDVRSVPVVFALDTALVQGKSYTLYGGGGVGYSLNSASKGSKYNEAGSSAVYLGLGLRIALTEHFALVAEDRYTYARAPIDPDTTLDLNVGGNLLSLGLMFHFLQPDDKGHPQAP